MANKKLLRKIVKNGVIYHLPTEDDYVAKKWNQSVNWVKTFVDWILVKAKNTDADSSKTTEVATEAQVAKKQDKIIAWDNITIWADWKTINAVDTTYETITKAQLDTWTDTTAKVVTAKVLNEWIAWMISAWVTYQGQVDDYDSLPVSANKGDMYNVVAEHKTAPKFPAWTNVVWNGTAWDPMTESQDLSNFVDKTTNQSIDWVKTFVKEPVLPSKSTDAWNNPTKPATEAQVAKKLDSDDLGNATISVKYGKQGKASVGSFTTNQNTAWELVIPWDEFYTQSDFDNLPASKSSDNNSYCIYDEVAE